MVTDREGPKRGWKDTIRHVDPRIILRRPKDDFRRLVLVNTVMAAVLLLVVASLANLIILLPHFGGSGGDWIVPPEIRFKDQLIQSSIVDGAYRWNISGNVYQLLHFHDDVRWSSLQARIVYKGESYVTDQFEVVYVPSRMVVQKPAMLPNEPVLYYEERAGERWRMDPGDVIGVAGANRSIQGCSLAFGVPGDPYQPKVIFFNIPRFNETFDIALGNCSVNAIHEGTQIWDATVPILSVSPSWERVSWGHVKLFVSYVHPSIGFNLTPYPGNESIGGPDTIFYYDEQGPGDGFIGPGDLIRVANIPQEWKGYDLSLLTGLEGLNGTRISQFYP